MINVRISLDLIIKFSDEGTLEDILTEANKAIEPIKNLCAKSGVEVDVKDLVAFDAELSA